MKKRSDPRHKKRENIIRELFVWQFQKDLKASETTKQVLENLKEIDDKIKKAATTWPIEQINRIDLAILRLSVYELTTKVDIPPKVVVDEAVELAKEYGADSSPKFVNGVLGKVIDLEGIST